VQAQLRQTLKGGAFTNVSAKRSAIMLSIKGSGNRTTEWRLRAGLVRAGVSQWQLHPSDVPGRPDFYFPSAKVAVFVDGCFWHGCQRCYHVPKRRTQYWSKKIELNQSRDRAVDKELRLMGIEVLRFWECQLKEALCNCINAVETAARAGERSVHARAER
jgi:DNA mismatch endonuclease, patch repair protein